METAPAGPRPEDHGSQEVQKAEIPLRTQIGFGLLCLDKSQLRSLDACEDRRIARLVTIDPDAQVDLGRTGILPESLDQGQQRVGRLKGKLLEGRSGIATFAGAR